MFKNIIIITLFIGLSSQLKSQNLDALGRLTSGGKEDGSKLIEAYIFPYANAFGSTMSAGWYNTAKPHKLGGFDLTLTANVAFVPVSDKSYDLSGMNLNGIYSEPTGPTAAGKGKGPKMSYPLNDSMNLTSFSMPNGTGLGFMPAPMIKAGIGIFKKTEIMGRYLPDMKLGASGSIGMWGVGLKHDLMQWMGIAEKVPALNISLMGAYTNMHTSVGLKSNPKEIQNYNNTETLNVQKLNLTFQNITTNLLISADLPVVVFYGGAGFSYTKTDLKLLGDFPYPMLDANGQIISSKLTDPINIKIYNKDGKALNPRLNAGIRFKMGIITLHFDYTKANYSIATLGLGISFR